MRALKPFEKVAAAAWAALAALAALDAARLLPLSRLDGLPLCAFRAVTGVPCPGCGMTHALVVAFQGRWARSYALHPLALPLLAVWTAWLAWGALNAARGRDFSAGWPDLLGGRRAWAALAVVLLVWGSRLYAGQAESLGCSINPRSLTPVLSEKAVDGPIDRHHEPHAIVEKAALKDGVHILVRQGDCERFGKRYEFSQVADKTPLAKRTYFLGLAASLLDRPLSADGALDDALAQDFSDAAPSLHGWLFERTDHPRAWGHCTASRCVTSFQCEDAVCTLEVRRDDPEHLSLIASFDFPTLSQTAETQ